MQGTRRDWSADRSQTIATQVDEISALDAGAHSGDSGTNFPVGATDIVPGVPLASILEVPLRKNGGRTPNHALVAGSPAIDAVPLTEPCPTTDQRNVGRPQGSACD
ncbi:MAG TPA: choice-of-anchor Q domain-containing protein, partial [Polyangiaceae bacterium]|nr:choice-of-anchor Q domain-containing protein [Polyangiaceae bacterium]